MAKARQNLRKRINANIRKDQDMRDPVSGTEAADAQARYRLGERYGSLRRMYEAAYREAES